MFLFLIDVCRRDTEKISVDLQLFVGQTCTGLAQPVFQVLGPKYSELWFDYRGRTTATALISIANPLGAALGELISPLIDDVRQSVRTRCVPRF